MYVAITGLRLSSPLHLLRFYRHAAPCHRAASKSSGNLVTEVRTVEGVQHTFTVWDSPAAARAFVHSDVHVRAVAAASAIGTGRIYSYETDRMPSWEEAYALWRENAWDYAS